MAPKKEQPKVNKPKVDPTFGMKASYSQRELHQMYSLLMDGDACRTRKAVKRRSRLLRLMFVTLVSTECKASANNLDFCTATSFECGQEQGAARERESKGERAESEGGREAPQGRDSRSFADLLFASARVMLILFPRRTVFKPLPQAQQKIAFGVGALRLSVAWTLTD